MTHSPRSRALIMRLSRAYRARLFPYNPYINKRAPTDDRAGRTGGFAARRREPSAPSHGPCDMSRRGCIEVPLRYVVSGLGGILTLPFDGRETNGVLGAVGSGDRCGAAHGKSAR